MGQNNSTPRDISPPIWVVWLLAIAYAGAVILCAVLFYRTTHNLSASWTGVGINPFQSNAGGNESLSVPGETPTMVYIEDIPDPWDGKRRVTILLMGLDYRDWVAGSGFPRTDTMMLATIDPITHTAGMLSIPRDLFVDIPYAGFEHNRINTAYPLGERLKLPGAGPALAMQTVENLLGVPIDYYAIVDFSTFERMIDEIGGIDVLVPQRVKISPIGGMSRWLEPKAYHLNGSEALAYARARKTKGGDFDRARRQQQVAMAIKDRIFGFDMIPTLIHKAPALYQELSSGIRTNMALDQMLQLGLLVINLSPEDISRGVIGPPGMVGFATLPDGRQVLRPVPDRIRELRDSIFINTGSIRPASELDAESETGDGGE